MGTKKRRAEAYALGKAGGRATLKKYGPIHYRKLAEKRWGKRKKA
jgi:hypothetical protein